MKPNIPWFLHRNPQQAKAEWEQRVKEPRPNKRRLLLPTIQLN